MANDTPEESRDYYEVTVREDGWDLSIPEPPNEKWLRPTYMITRGVVYPQRTYICSATPSQWVTWLGCVPIFDQGDVAPKACVKWWTEEGNKGYEGRFGDYFSYYSCCHDYLAEPQPKIGDVFLSVSERYTVKNKSGTPDYPQAANWMDNKAAKHFKPTLKGRFYGR